MRTFTRPVTAGLVAAAIVATSMGAASAGEDSAQSAADLIAAVAPDQGAVVAGATTNDAVTSQAAGGQVTVPLDANQPITLTGDDALPLELSLPREVTATDGQVAADGTVVYSSTVDGGADAAVQALADGSVRLQTITPTAGGPHTFTYTFGTGVVPVQDENGTIELVQESAEGHLYSLGVVQEPWAVDAEGAHQQTRYSIVGDTLVQTIDADPAAVYPIVADPTVRPGNGIYVRFSKSETRTIANNGIWLTASTGLCAVIPIIQVAGACVMIDTVFKDSLRNTFAKARNANQCVELRYVPFLTQWRLESWKGIKC
jgi:hypothetical protein